MRKKLLAAGIMLVLPIAAFAQSAMTASSLSVQDRSFVTMAAAAGLSEVQEGQLASLKGDAQVKNIGNKMITDHTKANNQLEALASSKGLTLPSQITHDQAAELSKLKRLNSASFDTAYLKNQHIAHVKAIELFESEISSGADVDLKSFASKTLPTLKMHLKMIEAAQ